MSLRWGEVENPRGEGQKSEGMEDEDLREQMAESEVRQM